MPAIRRLKKDINNLTFEVISDCFTFGSLHPDEHAEEVSSIISDAVVLRNSLIRRINDSHAGDDSRDRKLHFQNVTKDLFVGIDDLCKRLSELTGKAK